MAGGLTVEWLGTPFAARLGGRLWLAGCVKTREYGVPVFLEGFLVRWVENGVTPRPSDPTLQALLAASIHGGLLLLYEYNGNLALLAVKLTGKPLGFGVGPTGKVGREDVLDSWARLVLHDDLAWLDGIPLEYPGGLHLRVGSGPGLESPCIYVEARA